MKANEKNLLNCFIFIFDYTISSVAQGEARFHLKNIY